MKDKFILKSLFLLLCFFLNNHIKAQDSFIVNNIKYYQGSSTSNIVSVIANGYSGDVIIPESVSYNGKEYNVASIGKSAFAYCKELTSVTIPNSVTSMGDNTFFYCSSLKSITISTSVTSIGNSVFSHCTDLTSITIPGTVTTIGNSAFFNCTALASISIPKGVTSIGKGAFFNCTGLKSTTLSESLTSIGTLAFAYCNSLTSITIPNSVISIGESAFANCDGMREFIVNVNNLNFCSVEGVLYTMQKTQLIAYPKAKESFLYAIPNNVTSIEDYAFNGCSSLKSIIIPESVTSIGNYAFHGCSGLAAITIPESVDSIGNYTFAYCSSLTSITIPKSVTAIGHGAFSNCSGLILITTLNSVPPVTGDYTFDYLDYSKCEISVPSGAKEKYIIASGWSQFNKIIEFNPSDINQANNSTVKVYKEADAVVIKGAKYGDQIKVYSISGSQINAAIVNNEVVKIELAANQIYILSIGQKRFKVAL